MISNINYDSNCGKLIRWYDNKRKYLIGERISQLHKRIFLLFLFFFFYFSFFFFLFLHLPLQTNPHLQQQQIWRLPPPNHLPLSFFTFHSPPKFLEVHKPTVRFLTGSTRYSSSSISSSIKSSFSLPLFSNSLFLFSIILSIN